MTTVLFLTVFLFYDLVVEPATPKYIFFGVCYLYKVSADHGYKDFKINIRNMIKPVKNIAAYIIASFLGVNPSFGV